MSKASKASDALKRLVQSKRLLPSERSFSTTETDSDPEATVLVEEDELARGWRELERRREELFQTARALATASKACEQLAKSVSRLETAHFRAIGLVCVRTTRLAESQRCELLPAEESRLEFVLEEDGRFEVELTNVGSGGFCYLTELVYLGRTLCHGCFLRYDGDGQKGQLVVVKLYRPSQ